MDIKIQSVSFPSDRFTCDLVVDGYFGRKHRVQRAESHGRDHCG
jgi:hypothetical protein